nr:hypothetical protein [Tanacetum cinerariifolium]
MEKIIFTEPEMEAALQLIQLSGESDTQERSSGKSLTVSNDNSSYFVESFMKKRRQEDRDESHESSTSSEITSAPKGHVSPRFAANDDEDDYDSDGNMKKNKKKFRSIVEVYKMSRSMF